MPKLISEDLKHRGLRCSLRRQLVYSLRKAGIKCEPTQLTVWGDDKRVRYYFIVVGSNRLIIVDPDFKIRCREFYRTIDNKFSRKWIYCDGKFDNYYDLKYYYDGDIWRQRHESWNAVPECSLDIDIHVPYKVSLKHIIKWCKSFCPNLAKRKNIFPSTRIIECPNPHQ